MNQITSALEWIRVNNPEQYPQKFLQLVPLRCELRKMLRAQDENPAIAAYGESQKGKSYLMGNLLQKNGAPFMVRCGGKEYDFVSQINPIGDSREATGVVTRFTSYSGNEDRASDVYPARMKVMSVSHVVTILVDGYFNDLLDDTSDSESDVQKRADYLFRTYSEREICQNYLTEDDIMDIKLYMQQFLNPSKVKVFCRDTDYFDQVAQVIRRIPQSEWVEVFKILWYGNPEITNLFVRLLGCIQRLKFASVVYLPIEALLHQGENKNTVMSVECLNGLFSVESESSRRHTNVFVKQDDGSFACFSNIDMSELSALCLEISFKVEPEYLDDSAKFFYDPSKSGNPGYMSSEVFSKLTKKESCVSKKELLKVSDLMDFPGAKNREQMRVATLSKLDPDTQQANLVKLYLRGKVSFLFNYFSDSKALNVLLFCHNADDVKVTQMYDVIAKWVLTYVGDTPEKRQETLKLSGGVSPFFAIGTMFNKDMVQKASAEANSPKALQGRWKGRFSKVLYQDCFHAGTDVDWFKDWAGKSVPFNNVYVLRDFKYSGCDGQGNNLYRGYDMESPNPAETELALSPDFYKGLMESFIGDKENVTRFFADARVAWEASATMNNDGSLYIIQQLCTVAGHLFDVRNAQFADRADKIREQVIDLIQHYYKTNDSDAKLKENIRRSFDVLGEFDACSSDNSFFGRLIEMLQLTDDEAYDVVHDIVESPELVTKVVTFQNVEAIRRRIKTWGPFANVNEVVEAIRIIYNFPDKDAALRFLDRKHIDPMEFVSSTRRPQRRNSYVISEGLVDFWRKKISSSTFLSKATMDSSFETGVMSDLIDNILEMSDVVHLTERMSEAVATLTNVVNMGAINQFLVTDILRHMINSFVTDLGCSLLDPARADQLKKIAESQPNPFPVPDATKPTEKSEFSEEELTSLFEGILAESDGITPSYWRHYNAWLESMYYAYLATAGQVVIIENPVANEAIGQIISDLNEAV